MAETVDLRLPCVADSVRAMRRAVVRLARAAGMAEDRIEDLRLAVSEAATNAVRHGCQQSGDVVIHATASDREFRVAITDRGGGVRPRADNPGLGLGLPIMAAVSDEFEVLTDGEGTTVKLTFRVG